MASRQSDELYLAIIGRWWDGERQADIAAALGLSRTAVNNVVVRVMAAYLASLSPAERRREEPLWTTRRSGTKRTLRPQRA